MARTAWFLNSRTACLLFLTAASMYQQFSKRYEKHALLQAPTDVYVALRTFVGLEWEAERYVYMHGPTVRK